MESKNRNTKQRNILINCFKENHQKHLTVEDVYEFVKKQEAKIGIATVYRNVKYLEEQGVIKKVELPNALTCYELCGDMDIHAHHHLICEKCKEIFDFDKDLLENVEKLIEATEEFEITDHRVVFYGICKKCRE